MALRDPLAGVPNGVLLLYALIGIALLFPFGLWMTTVGLFGLGLAVALVGLLIAVAYIGLIGCRRVSTRLVHGRA